MKLLIPIFGNICWAPLYGKEMEGCNNLEQDFFLKKSYFTLNPLSLPAGPPWHGHLPGHLLLLRPPDRVRRRILRGAQHGRLRVHLRQRLLRGQPHHLPLHHHHHDPLPYPHLLGGLARQGGREEAGN